MGDVTLNSLTNVGDGTSLRVISTLSALGNFNNVEVHYRKKGNSAWIVSGQFVAIPFNPFLYVITELQPGTTYEVRLILCLSTISYRQYLFSVDMGFPLIASSTLECQTQFVIQKSVGKFVQKFLTTDAVYWPPDGFDNYGAIELGDPIQIKCRWQDQEVIFPGANGEQMLSVAKVYPDRELELDGYLMKGTLNDLDSGNSNPEYGVSAFPIRATEEHTDLLSKKSHYIVWLQKKIASGKIKGG